MKLREAIHLLNIVLDLKEQYTKEERIKASMRLEELLRLLILEE